MTTKFGFDVPARRALPAAGASAGVGDVAVDDATDVIDSGFAFSTKAAGLLLSAMSFANAFKCPLSLCTTSGFDWMTFFFSPMSFSRS